MKTSQTQGDQQQKQQLITSASSADDKEQSETIQSTTDGGDKPEATEIPTEAEAQKDLLREVVRMFFSSLVNLELILSIICFLLFLAISKRTPSHYTL